MINQRIHNRIETYRGIAVSMRAFAARQEARFPGRMDHIVKPALHAAELAEQIAQAYTADDVTTAKQTEDAYVNLIQRNSFLKAGEY